MFRTIVVQRQILPTLRLLGQQMAAGKATGEAFAWAVKIVAEQERVRPETIRDAFTRRLGRRSAAESFRLFEAWADGSSEDLCQEILANAEKSSHYEISEFFRGVRRPGGLAEGAEPYVGNAASRPVEFLRVALETDVYETLLERARAHGRAAELEAGEIIATAIAGARRNVAVWAADLRSRSPRHTGDSTADVRADRDR